MNTDSPATRKKKGTNTTTLVTSVSIPKNIHRLAVKKAADDNRPFSAYVTVLLQRDLESAAK